MCNLIQQSVDKKKHLIENTGILSNCHLTVLILENNMKNIPGLVSTIFGDGVKLNDAPDNLLVCGEDSFLSCGGGTGALLSVLLLLTAAYLTFFSAANKQ